MDTKSSLLPILCALVALLLTGCLTQRTVTDGSGTVQEQDIVIKRPIKELMNNSN
mgnify:CR=1 FL=1